MKGSTMLPFLAALGLGMSGIAMPSADRDVIWLAICGRPDMRVALEIDREEGPQDRRDCAKACHASLCRKAIGGETTDGARGARV